MRREGQTEDVLQTGGGGGEVKLAIEILAVRSRKQR